MRKNFPITTIEHKLRHDQYLISKTDLKGRITYANPAFVEISGFDREELLGKAHNIVRHPHIPPSVFKDMWDTLQAGKPWTGIVKNRRKDGGFYWVHALVCPIIESDTVIGYASVRVRPTDEQIQTAETLYEKLNNNTLNGYTLREGNVVPTGWRKVLSWLKLPFKRTFSFSMLRMVTLNAAATLTMAYFAFTGGIPTEHMPWALGGLAVLLVVVYAYGFKIAKGMTKPVENAALMAQQIAAGNLLLNIDTANHEGHHETSKLYFCLDLMRKGLTAIATDTHAGIQASQDVAQEIHSNNTLLSARTQNQADSLQQTAASMEELTITVQQNADNAQEASRLAERSMHTAQQGGQVVNELVTTMQDIHHRSKQIADIINVIDGIAFQTNILALNAAVESARAGEAGRGFAVVAGEVRSLAQRSAQAANEIKTLIDASVERVAAGARQAEHAGTTMHDVVTAVDQVNQIIHDIASASTEQATGLQQVHRAMEQMDGVTQQNNQLVGELGRTVEQLSAHAQSLDQAIRVLNTGATHTVPPQQTAERLLG
ncbi:methyl-accepting chemotaxis protein [Paenalcaligenes hominis]|uniref:methyl-accepting chemotaxis protein n=1 Tax=Paenalcaligenes hominis TaxID=643674 RepID=UPI003524A0F3